MYGRHFMKVTGMLSRASLALVAVVLAFIVGVFRLVQPLGTPYTSVGDLAFIELGVRQALHHGTALGVYSRFGWHHPGPALFYLLAPWYWLTGESSRGLFLGALVVNGTCALGVVAVVRRSAGERAARLTAMLVFAFVVIVGFGAVMDAWNPKLLALPMLLLMVTAAASYAGSAWALVGALAVASYLVQTHIGTIPATAGLVVLALVGFVRDRVRRTELRPSLRVPLIVAASVLALAWIGPLVQEVTHGNGNLSKTASFYRHPGSANATSHSLRSSIVVVSNHATVLPFGRPKDTRGDAKRELAFTAFAALGLVAAFVARRRAPFVAALGLTTTIGLVVAVLAATRVIGPQDGFLFYWTELVPVPAIVAGAWIAMDRFTDRRVVRSFDVAVAVGLVVLAAFSIRTMAQGKPTTTGDAPGARAVAQSLERAAGTTKERFILHVGTPRIDQGALSVQLDKDGYQFRLEPPVNLYGGNVTGDVHGPTFEVRDVGTPGPPGSAERFVATVGKVAISVH
ncbi:MAG TPA: glycosyltransferase family 39 protein [Acidimicrobiia bacterium]|nr:glycosyltransferase family 39 protein [Acidimicrobiia bacterium]